MVDNKDFYWVKCLECGHAVKVVFDKEGYRGWIATCKNCDTQWKMS